MQRLFAGMIAVTMAGTLYAYDRPRIQRVYQKVGRSYNKVGTAYLIPGVSQSYAFQGPWLERAVTVQVSGVPMTITDRWTGFMFGEVTATLKVPSSTARGLKNGMITIVCPNMPMTDCTSTNVAFQVMVLGFGSVTGVRVSSLEFKRAEGSIPRFGANVTVTGTNLTFAKAYLEPGTVYSANIRSRTATTLQLDVTTRECGAHKLAIGDEAEGGLANTYTGGLITFNMPCNLQTFAPRQ